MAPVLLFTLSEEGVSALRDVLVCLNKFNEEVCLEAKKDQVFLTALCNSLLDSPAVCTRCSSKFCESELLLVECKADE